MNKEEIQKAWDFNKKVFWEWNKFYNKSHELHHINGRIGVYKACLHLFILGERGHQNNYEWVNNLKKMYKNDIDKVKENYIKQLGCQQKLYNECNLCYFWKENK